MPPFALVRQTQYVAPWRRGEEITARRSNETVYQLNRLTRVVLPPRQADVFGGGGGASTIGTGDPLAVGYIRFFSS